MIEDKKKLFALKENNWEEDELQEFQDVHSILGNIFVIEDEDFLSADNLKPKTIIKPVHSIEHPTNPLELEYLDDE